MLLATMLEKRKQEGLVLGFYLLEHSANPVVLQETGHDRDICVWSIVCGHEYFYVKSPRNKISAEDDGS